jgi:hypothetical protein
MDREVEVTLRGFVSASDYAVEWESDGQYSDGDNSFRSRGGTDVWHDVYTLRPGNFLFVNWHPSDHEYRYVLMQVPTEPMFEKFLEAVSKARQYGWSDDRWILEFSVAVWDINDEEFEIAPMNLAEAVESYKHQCS